jgi:hypothetical protein
VPIDASRGLFELLRGTGHVLLLFDGAAATAEGYRNLRAIADRARERAGGRITAWIVVPRAEVPPALEGDPRVLLDADGALHACFGAGAECLYLVRPDGYVGFRAQPAEGDALIAHLARIFV